MDRTNLFRRIVLFLAAGTWLFFMLSLASFHTTDWPSHQVFPYPPIQNLCGSAGAWCAYYAFLFVGQGVFPILFFTGVCLALVVFNNRVGDWWLRTIGLTLLAISFAAAVHHFRPGTPGGFPEGSGGILGIGTATFLKAHFSAVGTMLVLLTAMLVGLLLAADDLVLRAPGAVSAAITEVRERTPQFGIKFSFPEMPKLPSLPGFRTRDSVPDSNIKPRPSVAGTTTDDDEPWKPPVMLERSGVSKSLKIPTRAGEGRRYRASLRQRRSHTRDRCGA